MIPVFFCCFVVFALWLRYELNNSNKAPDTESDEFWKRERESNFIPKKDISNLDYIQVPLDSFPFCDDTTDEKLADLQDKVRTGAGKKMLNLTGQTNTDLKFAYGSANYPLLADYDQNFTVFIRNLYAWAKYLHETDKIPEARLLLEFGVSCRSDVSGNYYLLGSIYLKDDELDAFHHLLEQAENIPGSRKDTIISHLTTMLQEYGLS